MKRFLTIAIIPLMLAGCAGPDVQLANARSCAPATVASEAVTNELLPLNGITTPARHLSGGSKFDSDGSVTTACTNAPPVPNPVRVRLDHLSAA